MKKQELPKGIYFDNGKYLVKARVNNCQINLGGFSTLDSAVNYLDMAVARALNGLDSVRKKVDILHERVRDISIDVGYCEDDGVMIDLHKLYIIVKSSTPFAAWQRNSGLGPGTTLGHARKFLAKRKIVCESLEDFEQLYAEKLELLLEPWVATYKILGSGPRKHSLAITCKSCGKPYTIKLGQVYTRCPCSADETLVFFERALDGRLLLSIGTVAPSRAVGCLRVPKGASVEVPQELGIQVHGLSELPDVKQATVEAISTPFKDTSLDFLVEAEDEDVGDEEEVEAYKSFLEGNAIDFDDVFNNFSSTDDAVTRKMLEEDTKEAAAQAQVVQRKDLK